MAIDDETKRHGTGKARGKVPKQVPRPFQRPPRAEAAGKMRSVRFSPVEDEQLQKLAAKAGVSVSEWIRRRSLARGA